MPPVPSLTACGQQPMSLTMKDVARHNHKEDCWLVIDSNVYDASRFVDEHPGGKVLATWAGSDASEVFGAFHPEDARELLATMFVGPLEDPKTDALLTDFALLKNQLENEGAFVPSHAYFAFKVVSNFALLFAGMYAISALGGQIAGAFVGAFLIALFWQQCGWLSHDFLHHQVFEDRSWGDAAGYFLGNVLQGFSVAWWKSKHNTHHAIPNVMEGVRDGDPDIQTMPFLAWADAFLEGEVVDGMPPMLIRYQHILFLPLLTIARISWVTQSLITVLSSDAVLENARLTELLTLCGHYAYYGAISYFLFTSWQYSLLFVFLSQAFAGLFLGTVFTINHNSMEVLDSDAVTKENFVAIQYRTTRNIAPSMIGDWFTGGLSYQIEHHLFPSLPRHRLGAIAPRVRALAAAHNLEYHSIGFFAGLVDVIACLKRIATLDSAKTH